MRCEASHEVAVREVVVEQGVARCRSPVLRLFPDTNVVHLKTRISRTPSSAKVFRTCVEAMAGDDTTAQAPFIVSLVKFHPPSPP